MHSWPNLLLGALRSGIRHSKTPADAHPPLLQVTQLVRHYTLPRTHLFQPSQQVQALQGVDFTVAAGDTLVLSGPPAALALAEDKLLQG